MLPQARFTTTASRPRGSSSRFRLPSPPHHGPGHLEPILSLCRRLGVRRLCPGPRFQASLRARAQTHLEAPPRLLIPRRASLRANGAPRPGIASARASCATATQTSPSAGALVRKPGAQRLRWFVSPPNFPGEYSVFDSTHYRNMGAKWLFP